MSWNKLKKLYTHIHTYFQVFVHHVYKHTNQCVYTFCALCTFSFRLRTDVILKFLYSVDKGQVQFWVKHYKVNILYPPCSCVIWYHFHQCFCHFLWRWISIFSWKTCTSTYSPTVWVSINLMSETNEAQNK